MKSRLRIGFCCLALLTIGVGAPAKATDRAGAKLEKQKEGVIPGITVPRKTGGGFYGIQIVKGNFVLSFYDEHKMPMTADRARALLRWPVRYKIGDERVVLNPAADGKSLTSERFIRPPYNFRLFVTLIGDDSDEADGGAETYVVAFQQ
jgi:hypothetical protein